MFEFKTFDSYKDVKKLLEMFSMQFPLLDLWYPDKAVFAKKLASKANNIVLLNDGRCVAFSSFYCNDLNKKVGYISMLAVYPGFERKGYASIMLEEIFREMKNCGMRYVKLEVLKDNIAAINLYKKYGFTICENSKDISFYMEKSLN